MNSGEEIPKDLPKVENRTLLIIGCAAAVALLLAFVLGFWVRHDRLATRERMAKEILDERPVVEVVRPKQTEKSFDLTLPADVRAFASTALYARTNGYLASWSFDINDRVKKGDVLAVISAPDTDADLEQAKANLAQQQSNYQLAATTDERYQGLVPVQGVTQQQLDQFRSSREQARSNVSSMAASVDRLKALVGFEKILAPFDGIVTARNYDVGALVSASNIAPGQELFDVAQDDWLRVFVNIPQAYSLLIKFEQPAGLTFERNFPGYRFVGVVKRSAGILDPVTRTLRTELDFKNADPAHKIFPGMYGEAVFHIEREHAVLTVPTSALLFEAEGKQVAVVDKDSRVHFQQIVLGRDFGTEIEIVSGLRGDERIIANPGEHLTEGLEVTAKDDSPPGGTAQDEPSGSSKPGDKAK